MERCKAFGFNQDREIHIARQPWNCESLPTGRNDASNRASILVFSEPRKDKVHITNSREEKGIPSVISMDSKERRKVLHKLKNGDFFVGELGEIDFHGCIEPISKSSEVNPVWTVPNLQ